MNIFFGLMAVWEQSPKSPYLACVISCLTSDERKGSIKLSEELSKQVGSYRGHINSGTKYMLPASVLKGSVW